MLSKHTHYKKTSYLLFIFLFFMMAIFSCAPETSLPDEVPPTICPEETITAPTPYSHSIANKYIVVLVDKSGSYRRYDSLHDYGSESLVLINDVLSETLFPGDRVFIDWIANDKDHDREKVIFEGEVEKTVDEMPNYSPTPTFPEIIPTQLISGTDIQKDKIKKHNLEIDKQNNIKLARYYCDVYEWNLNAQSKNKNMEDEWLERQGYAIDKFMIPLSISIGDAIKEKHSQETHLFEGLSIASRKFHDPLIQKHYSKYLLIIFSDMIDSHRGEDEYKHYDIDLNQVDVLVGNYLCLKEYKTCLDQTVSIQERFQEIYKAKSALVKFPVETNQEILINFIEKGQ